MPSRTTIAHLFQNHMIHTADAQVLVSLIASAIDYGSSAPASPTRSIAYSMAGCATLNTKSTPTSG